MAPPMVFCPTYTEMFQYYKDLFDDGWKHPYKHAEVVSVMLAPYRELFSSYRARRFEALGGDLGSPDCKIRFHGSQRACHFGDHPGKTEYCHNPECGICGILRRSFEIDHARSSGMFGPGIYTTTASSKADCYARNIKIRCTNHAVLICAVVSNRPQYLAFAQYSGPDPGYDSVEAITRREGGSVEYPETVVYDNSAIVPIGVVIYKRWGWMPG